ncbi:hypothetical protein Pmani_030915 [Petrolisthes manimaculis]|uniref:Uncharacterized protein n=1 Tax=Petrolisthes manimaculis TaxID=1843537 RepID=A0AAE1NUN5_9EUCA|nr:hypothetical protein Pmani_030915 [Petrolisthes manimaculis]
MIEFSGRYRLEKNENLEELLTKLDVGLVKRKVAGLMRQTVEVRVKGEEWMLVTHTPLAALTWTFTLDHLHQLVTSDGGRFKATFYLEGNCLTQHTIEGPEADLLVMREFQEHYMMVVSTSGI